MPAGKLSASSDGSSIIQLDGGSSVQKITAFLWFDGNAEEAMTFYTSIFKNSKIGEITRYGDAGPGPKGSVMTGTFEIEGPEFMALNGGPYFKFTPAISFFVNCETQSEVDELREKLSAASISHSGAGESTREIRSGFLLRCGSSLTWKRLLRRNVVFPRRASSCRDGELR
jgi:predicted 3-demethylubiquinone-9 3-methyltransferase (glyoxalase superfamily)